MKTRGWVLWLAAVSALTLGCDDDDDSGGGDGGTGGDVVRVDSGAGGGGDGGGGGEAGGGGVGAEGGSGGIGGSEPVGEIIECGDLPEVEGTCAVEAGGDAILIRGTILKTSQTLMGGEVLVSPEGMILCVGCDCAEDPSAAGATVVTCPDGVVSPGLINAHDHITYTQNHPADWGDERYEHRHDWRKGIRGHTKIGGVEGRASREQMTWGELRQVLAGTTSLAGSGSADGLLRNLDRRTAQEGLNQGEVGYETFPLDDGGGTLRASGCDYGEIDSVGVLNDDCYLPHISEGIDVEARNEFLCLSSDDGGGTDLVEGNTAIIHAIGLNAFDGDELAQAGASVIWSPRSNVSLYGNTAQVTMYANQGVRVGIGTDWTPSGSINMLRELQCAVYLNDNHYGGFFSSRDIWHMATGANAAALAVDDATGALRAGYVADIAIFAGSGDDPYAAVINAGVADTVLVLRGGDTLYGDDAVVRAMPDFGAGCEPIPGGVCNVDKQVCVQGDTGLNFNTLSNANSSAYGLFFCGEPADEPTCVPMREGEYNGVTGDDTDGDGVANAADNCPNIFNPIRPVDNGVQGDADADGVGDVCDVCPLDADTDTCSVPDANDRDRDGVANDVDNCPMAPNEDQADRDNDLIGDACDQCPDHSNLGGVACPASIYDIKGTPMPEGNVAVNGVVTAASEGFGFFMQVAAEQDGYSGADNSGVFVYVGSNEAVAMPSVGDAVSVTGSGSEFYGQQQLTNLTRIDQIDAAWTIPAPVVVDAAEVATGGARAAALEGMLVQVNAVEVIDIAPEVGAGDHDPTNEFVVTGGLVVNDLFFLLEPFPAVGAQFNFLGGVLRFANGNSKLEPTGLEDLGQGPANVRELGPEGSVIRAGTTGVPGSAAGSLKVFLTSPAPEGGLHVALVSSDPDVFDAGEVVVPEGELSAPIVVVAMQAGSATLTASLNDSEAAIEITVLDADAGPSAIVVTPSPLVIGVDGTVQLTVSVDVPAPAAGYDFTIVSPNFVTAPAQVQIAAGEVEVSFDVTGDAEGEGTLTASFDGLETQIDVSVVAFVGSLVINEVNADMDGDENDEFVELFNGGADVDLTGYTLELINGNGGTSYLSVELSGTLAAGDYLVWGDPQVEAAANGAQFYALPNAGHDIQNGNPDGVRLLNAAGEAVDGISYGGGIPGTSEGDVGAPDDMNDAAGQSISRCANGVDTDDNAADFALAPASPGAANTCE